MAADDLHSDEPLEQLLVRAAPAPSLAFEAQLERRLFGPGAAAAPKRSWRGIGALVAATGGLATVVVVAGLVGSGPLSPDGGSSAKAKPGCVTVYVTKVEPSGQVVKRPDGSVTVETTRKPVVHQHEQCQP